MTDKVYLIHEEDYVKHIRDKDRLFWLLKRMIKQVIDLQPTRDNKELFICYYGFRNIVLRTWSWLVGCIP